MVKNNLQNNIDYIIGELGTKSTAIVRTFNIGKGSNPVNAALIYINALVSKDLLDKDVLTPLMFRVDENLYSKRNLSNYICENYIPICNTILENDLNKVVMEIKTGKTTLLINNSSEYILLDTTAGNYRSISDPVNESSIRGSREGFIENIETNISILRRKIGDKNLCIEDFKVGRRSQTTLALLYIQDIVDDGVLDEIKMRINSIDVDSVTDTGMIEQYIEDSPFSPFPQIYTTERPDIVKSNLMEGQVAIILNGTPQVLTLPGIFVTFFQGVEDYNQRTIVSSFVRILRLIAIFTVITLPSLYLSLMQYNVELIPIKFITPLVQSRKGIALPPFMEILSMEIIIEFLREGGLRLPPKIAQTLSIVGGIIIGNTAVESKIVSPTTLLVIGISVVSSFLIPNYEMSLSLRFIRFPMLFITNALGFLGIALGWFFIAVHISSLKSVTVPYFELKLEDLKDIFIRAPLWEMNKRPESLPIKDIIRQLDFRKFWRKKNE